MKTGPIFHLKSISNDLPVGCDGYYELFFLNPKKLNFIAANEKSDVMRVFITKLLGKKGNL